MNPFYAYDIRGIFMPIKNDTTCLLAEHGIQNEGEFIKLRNLYEFAIEEVKLKLQKITDEFYIQYQYSPIHHVESRLKTPTSIVDKLIRKGLNSSAHSARENITDIAGVRIICSYIEDIYAIADMICMQEGVSLVRKSDYIKKPKANGYRSLHLVVMIPILSPERRECVPVEIQIRSTAMDFWASLEHQIYYKRRCDSVPDSLVKRMKECADKIAEIDVEMQTINKEINILCINNTENDCQSEKTIGNACKFRSTGVSISLQTV